MNHVKLTLAEAVRLIRYGENGKSVHQLNTDFKMARFNARIAALRW
jgi:hypothetical protein